MRILFFLSDTSVGGAQRTIINLVNRMNEINIDVNLVVALEGGEAQKWLNDGIPITELNASRTRWALFSLRKVLLRMKPDVLVTTMVDANILATIASLGLRKKMRVILRETNSHGARGDIKLLRRLLIQWSYKRADTVVALSTGVHNELLHTYGLDPDKIVTIGNPVKIHHFSKQCRSKAIKKLGIVPEDVPIIIAIGRLTHQKGFDILIKAFANVKSRAKLVILGEGTDRKKLQKLAEQMKIADRFLLPGFVERPDLWLASAQIFVMSSRWEGFGHVIVEAMAAGVAVITTNCPYGPADIVEHEKNGIVVEEGDSKAIASAIDELLNDQFKANRLVESAFKSVTKFSDVKITDKYLSLFREEK